VAKFEPGHKRLGGRKAGTPNKFTTLKNAWTNVFVRMGGEDELLDYAQNHKAWFYSLITKLFPQEVAHSGVIDSNLTVEIIRVKDTIEQGGGA
jgi:hypothetical protein